MLIPVFKVPESELVCELVGLKYPWYKDLYNYLHDPIIPLDLSTNQCKTFIQKSSKYVIISDTLYRRSLCSTLLRCLDSNEAQMTLQEVHNGICGAHSVGPTLAKKLMRMGYYCPTMKRNSYYFMKKFCQCQIHGDLVQAPAQELHPLTSHWPFSQWGLDLVGKIQPTSANGHNFILVATE